MLRFALQRPQNQQVQRPLRQFNSSRQTHLPFYFDKRINESLVEVQGGELKNDDKSESPPAFDFGPPNRTGSIYPIGRCADVSGCCIVLLPALGPKEQTVTSSLVDFSNELAKTVERTGNSVISVLDGGRSGVSGTIWRQGVAVTIAHTIRGLDEVTVVLPSGTEAKAAVAGRDPGTDIAILKLDSDAPAATLADDAAARVGEVALAVARRGSDGLAAAYGIVGAIGGAWRTWTGSRIDRWLRLDLSPFPGFSGGPIVNASGEALGIATSGPGRSAAVIPTSTVNRVVDQLLKHGRPVRGYIGVGLQPVAFPEDAWHSLGITSGNGLLITTIASGSAAEEAKLTLGDVIVTIEGNPIRPGSGLHWLLDAETIGKSIKLGVIRGGSLLNVPVTVREKSA